MTDFIPISISVANRISDRILLEKRYAPNDKLPNEHKLAQELGVSRTSIREAVKTLVAVGLLRVERGRGTFVAPHFPSPEDPFGVSYLEDKKKLAVQWFEMRLIMEPSIVRLACERASDREIRTIMACERAAAAVIEQNRNFSRADQKFHAAIAKAAHNDVIERMLPAMTNAIEDILRTSLYSGRQERSRENALANHRMIARFIEQRDAEGGAMAMYYHIKKGLMDLQ
ncbi:MAG: FadR family transcriptional regulator [Deltaproteobacteria bacterium]|jgi:DNA-binding FadR family transcriptional regulator|nr:FadR family transcriptional regulator [Deltaproteobacteria bacterium]